MALALRIINESATGRTLQISTLQLVSECVTVRDMIQQRVRQEVDAYNQKASEYFLGLVQPYDTEQTLNGFRMRKRRQIFYEKQVELALVAF